MINDQKADLIQQVCKAYAQVVKQDTGADMVCVWGAIDPKSKVLATGVSMSSDMEHQDLTDVLFYMQKSLFNNLRSNDEE